MNSTAKEGIWARYDIFVLFALQTLEGTVDPLSLHGGCPVVVGEKWSSTKWIREKEFV
jgi:prolyl 4-hydroxylase